MKYHAALITKIDGQEKRILITSKKHNYFDTLKAAEKKLETVGKRLKVNSRGIIFEAGTDGNISSNWIVTIAL